MAQGKLAESKRDEADLSASAGRQLDRPATTSGKISACLECHAGK
jgi:hypothetical protein